ncbi:hypothetical protein V202x_42870 [Gimesia aquarii]|uniref:Uncharacterized protein n=1 Tax=Gimesia aquarii TaxID=2527964 RepID=A0A517X063_9PLAN|nr:hypothetical protein V202x_42870 [Gimesia aquarii]
MLKANTGLNFLANSSVERFNIRIICRFSKLTEIHNPPLVSIGGFFFLLTFLNRRHSDQESFYETSLLAVFALYSLVKVVCCATPPGLREAAGSTGEQMSVFLSLINLFYFLSPFL